MREKLQASGKMVDVDTDYQLGMPELRITPERARTADLGVSIESVAATIDLLVGGVRVGKYNTGGRRIDVRLRLLADQRSRPEELSRLKVRTASGELVPLSSLVQQDERPSPAATASVPSASSPTWPRAPARTRPSPSWRRRPRSCQAAPAWCSAARASLVADRVKARLGRWLGRGGKPSGEDASPAEG